MSEVPETRYTKSGEVHVAYQVLGDGPIDIVVVPGLLSHVEFFWELPGYAQFMRGLASFARVITFDKRGCGLSDPISDLPGLDERLDDLRAVMDATDTQCASLLGISEGAALSLVFAASHPERVTHVAALGGFARLFAAPDYPHGIDSSRLPWATIDDFTSGWGGGVFMHLAFPSHIDDDSKRTLWSQAERLAYSPGAFLRQLEMDRSIDIRDILGSVPVPVLVMHAEHDQLPSDASRYIAEHVPDGQLVEIPDVDHYPWFDDTTPIVEQLAEFFTGAPVLPATDRVLRTVLFTDIVDSTGEAARLGDTRWHQILDAHDQAVRRALQRFHGTEVNTTGDGFIAAFDAPGRAIRCAQAIIQSARAIGLGVRAGVHIGECEIRGDDLAGIAVHIGARVCALAQPGEVLTTSTVRDLVTGADLHFDDRGPKALRGVPGEWTLLAVRP